MSSKKFAKFYINKKISLIFTFFFILVGSLFYIFTDINFSINYSILLINLFEIAAYSLLCQIVSIKFKKIKKVYNDTKDPYIQIMCYWYPFLLISPCFVKNYYSLISLINSISFDGLNGFYLIFPVIHICSLFCLQIDKKISDN